MKHIVKYSLKWCLAITFSLLCFACEKDANFKEYAYPVPEITGIYPVSGYVGSQVAILGKDFGDQIEAVKVTFATVLFIMEERYVLRERNRIATDAVWQMFVKRSEYSKKIRG